jgi:hypothetical protein
MTLENSPVSKFVLICASLFCWWVASLARVPSASLKTHLFWVWLSTFGFLLVGIYLFWSGLKSKIRVDDIGIWQTNGFTRQYVRWVDVAAYYWTSPSFMPQPVLLGTDGAVLLRGFPRLAGVTMPERDRYQPIRDFAEDQLKGKEIESPFLHAAFWVPGGTDVDIARQSLMWKIMHGLTWMAYTALWLGLVNRLLYYRFVVKTGLIASWVGRWLFPTGSAEYPLVLMLFLIQLPPLLLVLWQRRRVHRHLLPFKFVTPTEPNKPHPLQ